MRKFLALNILWVLAVTLSSCGSDNPEKDGFYKGTWELQKVLVGPNSSNLNEQIVIEGELKLKGRRGNAKRGSYSVKYTMTYFDVSAQENVTQTISAENEFVWHVAIPASDQEEPRVNFYLDNFEDKLFGLGDDVMGDQPTEMPDENTLLIKERGHGKYEDLFLEFQFSRK